MSGGPGRSDRDAGDSLRESSSPSERRTQEGADFMPGQDWLGDNALRHQALTSNAVVRHAQFRDDKGQPPRPLDSALRST